MSFAQRMIAHFNSHAAVYHQTKIALAREETRWLVNHLSMWGHVARKGLVIMLVATLPILHAQPPPPPMSAMLRTMGKEGTHYTLPVSVLVTQTVTTVYELDYIRYIRTKLGESNVLTFKTNFLLLETNVVSVVTNTTPLTGM